MLQNKTNLQTRIALVENELQNLKLSVSASNGYVDHLSFISELLKAYNQSEELTANRLKSTIKKALSNMGFAPSYINDVVACDSEYCKATDEYDPVVYPLQVVQDFRKAAYNLLLAFDNNDFCNAVNDLTDDFPFDRSLDEWILQAFDPWAEAVQTNYQAAANKLLYDAEERGWYEFDNAGNCMVWYKNVHCKDDKVRAVGINEESIVLYRASTETIDVEEYVCNINSNPYAEVYLSERQINEIYRTQQDYCDYYNVSNLCTVFEPVDIKKIKK